ncbi:MAG TPA: hypothetical protein VKE96_12515 [Vicinamibacterales bacterium]|nr:hypothetical protein [Vicinamibacterales bacterium]
MGVRILHDTGADTAVLYCSTTDWAFGPLFYSDDQAHGAEERAEAFLRWITTTDTWWSYERHTVIAGRPRDARQLTDGGLERAYGDWRAQEAAQWAREEAPTTCMCGCDLDDRTTDAVGAPTWCSACNKEQPGHLFDHIKEAQ